jgi:hypothetical protein
MKLSTGAEHSASYGSEQTRVFFVLVLLLVLEIGFCSQVEYENDDEYEDDLRIFNPEP